MEDTRGRWERAFLEAVDFDTWGQVEEALEGYQRLQVAAAAEYVENVLQLPASRRDGIGKLAAALKHRIQELQSNQDRGVGLVGMKTLKPYMKEIITTDGAFPIVGIKAEGVMTSPTIDGADSGEERDEVSSDQHQRYQQHQEQQQQPRAGPVQADGTLRGPPSNLRHGDNLLSIFIEKWGFKEAVPFNDPRVVVSVRDESGGVLEPAQETPKGKSSGSNYVFFENTVYIQTSLTKLPKGAAIFFEFKHYKTKQKKWSCKAYAFLEMDEVRDGPVTLEVYKKPAVYVRSKKPSLLTIKPFYLHLGLTTSPQ